MVDEKELSTEEKIKETARIEFMQKGYKGARIKDIAEKAGINLALLNYYFRSKENLFEIIMQESLSAFFINIISLMNDENLSLSNKIDLFVNRYTDMLKDKPDLPLFILGEMQADPTKLMEKMGILKFNSYTHLFKQLNEQLGACGLSHIHPVQFIWNILSLIIFPFVSQPIMQTFSQLDKDKIHELLEDRRKLIPIWIKSMIGIES